MEYTVWRKFLRVLIFAIFEIFPAIRKNKFPQKVTPECFFIQKQNGIQQNTGLLFENMYF